MSDTEEGAWLSSSPLPTEAPDFPLSYYTIFSECQPSDGTVSIDRLGQVLSRAQIPSEASAQILAHAAPLGSSEVSEQQFFWGIAHAAALQADNTHLFPSSVGTPGEDLPFPPEMHELQLSDELQPHIFEQQLTYNPAVEYQLQVSLQTADAGSYFSKHAVFSIDGVFGDQQQVKCVHRFRDFAELHDLLILKYPFRAVPVLPPKRLALNGRFLVGNTQSDFLERRAAGLTRFVHLVAQHPVFSQDAAVQAFLMVKPPASTDLTEFGGSASEGPLDASNGHSLDDFNTHQNGNSNGTSASTTTAAVTSSSSSSASSLKSSSGLFSMLSGPKVPSELDGQVASPLFITQWNNSVIGRWQRVEQDTKEQFQHVSQLCVVLNRQIQRFIDTQTDLEQLGRSSLALARSLEQVYPDLQEDLPEIRSKMEQLNTYSSTQSNLLSGTNNQLAQGPLEQLKLYRDMLASGLELFRRFKLLSKNTIPEQHKKISNAQRKLTSLATMEHPKEEELHRQRTLIQTAQAEIRNQTNRDWLIKMVMQQELQTVQTMQYQLSRFLRKIGSVEADSLHERSEEATKFMELVEGTPIARS